MPVPAIPPEIVEEILKQLPPDETFSTVTTLLACTLVSHDFAAIAKQDSIWGPIARDRSQLEREPTFVELTNQEDRKDMELGFPIEPPANKIPHVLALAELGEVNAVGLLRSFIECDVDVIFPEDWLARRYWAKQALGLVLRKRAIEVWRRIGEGWDGAEAFAEGIFAFAVFRGTQDRDDVDFYLAGVTPMLKSFGDFLEAEYHGLQGDMNSLKDVAALLEYSLRHSLRVRARPLEDSSDTPEPAVSDFFAHEVLRRIAEAHESGDESRIIGSHKMVVAAVLCAALKQVERYLPLVFDPVIALDCLFIKVGWTPASIRADEFFMLGFIQPMIFPADIFKALFDVLQTKRRLVQELSFDAFCAPASARDLLHLFATELGHALSVDQHRLGADSVSDMMMREDFASGHYAWALCATLIRPISPIVSQPLPINVAITMLSILVKERFGYDVELLRDHVLPHLQGIASSGPSNAFVHLIEGIKTRDAEQRIVQSRSETAAPRFKLGDVVGLKRGNVELEVQVITGWEVVEVDSHGDSTSRKSTRIGYETLTTEGVSHVLEESDNLQLHRATKKQIKAFLEVVDIGQYFKQVDPGEKNGRAPSFIMAEDVRKVYPDG
ncbi:hypothetical protein BCR35DRAFT_331806 [Leucosporidium creatinivorum]|uniref:F-box domain-containing protein n=1 Tax=Leucosporidium creatinivorum TaxID=106004 RepID=A0A1Y2FBC7_9BASI|nr:hypothetical protein BCR35DRAFT_331806 [Leucosporidium creatinivorum]